MYIYKYVDALQFHVSQLQQSGKKVAFVPTMGALHEGHLSLVKLAKEYADIVVVSIFVNPTQFNESSDLESYPRTLTSDSRMLIDKGTTILFAPGVSDVYPESLDTAITVDLNGLDTRMEGAHRPGHFAGMLQVVNRLLQIVGPDYLIMGQKDYQQFKIVQYFLDKTKSNVSLIMAPISREEDGLARSSRNVRLTDEMRQNAPSIHQTLNWIAEHWGETSIANLEEYAISQLSSAGLKPEYVSIVDRVDLLPVHDASKPSIVCTAAWAGDVRLIDNLLLG